MICQACGIEAATKYVSFHENIGVLFMRFSRSMQGNLCKNCIHKHFWKMTGTTAVVGWWGMISFIVTPFFLLNNIGRYAMCLRMPPVGPDATIPSLSSEEFDRISPLANGMFDRLNGGQAFEVVVAEVAESAGVTPGQVLAFIRAIASAAPATPSSQADPEPGQRTAALSASDFPNLRTPRTTGESRA